MQTQQFLHPLEKITAIESKLYGVEIVSANISRRKAIMITHYITYYKRWYHQNQSAGSILWADGNCVPGPFGSISMAVSQTHTHNHKATHARTGPHTHTHTHAILSEILLENLAHLNYGKMLLSAHPHTMHPPPCTNTVFTLLIVVFFLN